MSYFLTISDTVLNSYGVVDRGERLVHHAALTNLLVAGTHRLLRSALCADLML